MKAAVLTSTAIINEIDIFNYPFPAFIRQLKRTAKEQLLASARKMENKEGRICLDERWAAVFHQYVCVVHHRWSTFPPGVSNTDGHDGVYQWSYTNSTVPHLHNYSDCFLPLHVGWEPQLCLFKSTDCMWQIYQMFQVEDSSFYHSEITQTPKLKSKFRRNLQRNGPC